MVGDGTRIRLIGINAPEAEGEGSRNGPVYVSEKNIRVVGPDVYGLDGTDNDGLACES